MKGIPAANWTERIAKILNDHFHIWEEKNMNYLNNLSRPSYTGESVAVPVSLQNWKYAGSATLGSAFSPPEDHEPFQDTQSLDD